MAPPTVNDLPDEVLARILKLAADSPPFAFDRRLPLAVVAGRVSRRWRSVTLGSPDLWTTIKIFDNSRSCHWAAVFAERSKAYPLDISINVQSYGHTRPWDPGHRALRDALAIVGPQIARWRTLALRGWSNQLEDLCQFMLQSSLTPYRLESLHLDEVMGYRGKQPLPLDVFFAGGHLRALRVNTSVPHMLASFNALHSLDIQCDYANSVIDSPQFQHLLASSTVLSTLVLRDFRARERIAAEVPIIAASVCSLSIRFKGSTYWWDTHDHNTTFNSLNSRFSFPNLESLELVDGFLGRNAEWFLPVPEPWETPLFGPYLRTLRLEKLGFSRKGLALIQSFSPDITHLELIHITRNAHLLARSEASDPWPALRSLTVEATGNFAPRWVVAFLAVRAAIPQRRIEDLALSPWEWGITMDGGPWPALHWQRGGPSAGLTEAAFGVGKFYLDDSSMRVVDFEDLWDMTWDASSLYPSELFDDDSDAMEEVIKERFRMKARLIRSKDRSHKSSRYKPTRKLLDQNLKRKGKAQRRRHDLREDFYIT